MKNKDKFNLGLIVAILIVLVLDSAILQAKLKLLLIHQTMQAFKVLTKEVKEAAKEAAKEVKEAEKILHNTKHAQIVVVKKL